MMKYETCSIVNQVRGEMSNGFVVAPNVRE